MSWLLLCCAPASAQTQGIKRRNERRDDRVPGTLTCSNSRDQQQPTRRFLGRCSAHSFRRLANPFVIVSPQESNRFIDGINASRNINILGRGESNSGRSKWPRAQSTKSAHIFPMSIKGISRRTFDLKKLQIVASSSMSDAAGYYDKSI